MAKEARDEEARTSMCPHGLPEVLLLPRDGVHGGRWRLWRSHPRIFPESTKKESKSSNRQNKTTTNNKRRHHETRRNEEPKNTHTHTLKKKEQWIRPNPNAGGFRRGQQRGAGRVMAAGSQETLMIARRHPRNPGQELMKPRPRRRRRGHNQRNCFFSAGSLRTRTNLWRSDSFEEP